MNKQIIKPIVVGLLVGAGLYFAPFFILRVALFFLIAGFIFRLFGGRRRFQERRFQMADRIRNMTEEEYTQFKKAAYGCGRRNHFYNQQTTHDEK